MTREELYDSQISPRMKEIILLCKEHDIPFLAVFELTDERGNVKAERRICRSSIAPQTDACSIIEAARAAIYPPEEKGFAMTVLLGAAR